ncbi:MAG: nucleotidyltransferase domain-containing protein [Deinococcota bacterium]
MTYGLSEQTRSAIQNVLCRYPDVMAAKVFGSRATDTYTESSDIDLALLGDISFAKLMTLETELDDLLLPYKIDVVRYDNLDNASFRDAIDRGGKLFYERKPVASLPVAEAS